MAIVAQTSGWTGNDLKFVTYSEFNLADSDDFLLTIFHDLVPQFDFFVSYSRH